MPATAGRVRMPANNRVHSSAALQTHGIWQSAIGYDPYAPKKDDSKTLAPHKACSEPEAENAYASFQGLLALARITGSNADEARGACKKCRRVGHLTFQCRNILSVRDDVKGKEPEAIQAAVVSGLDKGKKAAESDTEDEESESSDSDADSEIERIIAERYGKKSSSKGESLRKREEGSDSGEKRKKRRKSKKRRSGEREHDGSEDEDEGRRKRRKRDESCDEDDEPRRHKRKSKKEKKRRRSHRHPDYSDSDMSEDARRRHKRKSRKAESDFDS